MRLFHFTSATHGLESIRDKKVKISQINKVNDPFEFMGIHLKNSIERKAWRRTKDQLSRDFGMVSMSKYFNNPLLWAHYAENHRGLCLEIDVKSDVAMKVVYQKNLINIQDFKIDSLDSISQDQILTILNTKFIGWEYEHEYRIFTDLKDKDPVSDLYFLNFSDNFELKRILVGIKSDLSSDRIQETIDKSKHDGVTFCKMRQAFNTFGIVENRAKKRWRS